jgi:hypothetical protein
LLVLKKYNSNEINSLENQERKFDLLIKAATEVKPNFKEELQEMNLIEDSRENLPEEVKISFEMLKNKREEQKSKLLVENEYTNSIMNMIKNEKNNLKSSEDKYFEFKDKLRKIKLSMTNIEINIKEGFKKSKNMVSMNKGLKEEIEKMNNLILNQNNQVGFISFSLERQTSEVLKTRQILKEKNMVLDRETKLKKLEMKTMVVEAAKQKILKLNNENRASRLVLGLDLIKR